MKNLYGIYTSKISLSKKLRYADMRYNKQCAINIVLRPRVCCLSVFQIMNTAS